MTFQTHFFFAVVVVVVVVLIVVVLICQLSLFSYFILCVFHAIQCIHTGFCCNLYVVVVTYMQAEKLKMVHWMNGFRSFFLPTLWWWFSFEPLLCTKFFHADDGIPNDILVALTGFQSAFVFTLLQIIFFFHRKWHCLVFIHCFRLFFCTYIYIFVVGCFFFVFFIPLANIMFSECLKSF